MPYKALKFCSYPGCNELVSVRYCPVHQKIYDDAEAIRNAEYEKTRLPAAERGYDATWQAVSQAYLREHPLCETCEDNGRTRAAVLVHHIVPLSEGGARLNSGNLRALCTECHERIHKHVRYKKRTR